MDNVFFNFPIALLKPAFSDISKVCQNIIDYAIYKHAKTLQGNALKKVKDSADYFGIQLANPSETFDNGIYLNNIFRIRPVMTGINKDLLFEYYKNDKTEFDIVLLLSFLAMKSILGKKSYCRITTEFLMCRMAGYASESEMTEIPAPLKKYMTRYHMDALKFELRRTFGLKIYGRYTRGFFVSFELTEEQLIKEVEIKRKKYAEKKQKDDQSLAVKKVLKELYLTNTITTPIQHL
jgi:hypothetical protein